MNALAHLALFGWVPFTLALFALLPKRDAALAALCLGAMFVPITRRGSPGQPVAASAACTEASAY